MGPYSSFCIPVKSNGSLWVLIDPHSSLWILIGPYGFFNCSQASLWILMGPYVSV